MQLLKQVFYIKTTSLFDKTVKRDFRLGITEQPSEC